MTKFQKLGQNCPVECSVFLRHELVTLFLNDMTRLDRLFKDSLTSKLIYEH